VYVHTNLHHHLRRSQKYSHEKSRIWNQGGYEYESLDVAGILEVAKLSLDEPELEVVVFGDDNN